MGDCIICGTSTDGPICETHQQDVAFEFRGDHPNQLTPGRFYRGTVDGYADFGVFVDIADGVTGLLHRSKLDRRLESLDWEPGDEVFVEVTNVRDNGDIDLEWSIRQSPSEFRGMLVDEPDGDRLLDEDAEEGGETGNGRPEPATGASSGSRQSAESTDGVEVAPPDRAEASAEAEEANAEGGGAEPDEPGESGGAGERRAATEADDGEAAGEPADRVEADEENAEPPEADVGPPYDRVPVADLRERVGDDVRVEGEVVGVRQTGGPTVFEVRDETAAANCAAFEEAGVRAYPEVEVGDVVAIDGEVRLRREELQVETETLAVLEGEEAATVTERMAAALEERARPDAVEPLADDPAVSGVVDAVGDAATAVRRAVLESRPVVVRHAASTDGYVAGTAIERAVLPLVREEHARSDAAYHYFDRRPLEDGVYGMDDATMDVTKMLDDRERHDEKLPLFVFAGAGSGADSLDGLEFLDVYDAERVVVDGGHRGSRVDAGEGAVAPAVRDAVDVAVAPGEPTTASALAATLAGAVNGAVREELRHLPAVSFWDEVPDAYLSLAAEAGYDAEELTDVRQAVALEAYYQAYEDKRELIADVLFEERGLAAQVARQFRTKLDDELATAEANVERSEVGDRTFAVLDAEAFTHRYDFPPADLLLDELHRRDGAAVTVGLGEDDLRLRADDDLDLRAVADGIRERVDTAGVTVRDGPAPHVEFLSGERAAVLEATMEAVAGLEGAPAA